MWSAPYGAYFLARGGLHGPDRRDPELAAAVIDELLGRALGR